MPFAFPSLKHNNNHNKNLLPCFLHFIDDSWLQLCRNGLKWSLSMVRRLTKRSFDLTWKRVGAFHSHCFLRWEIFSPLRLRTKNGSRDWFTILQKCSLGHVPLISVTKDQPLLYAISRTFHWLPLIPMNWIQEITKCVWSSALAGCWLEAYLENKIKQLMSVIVFCKPSSVI